MNPHPYAALEYYLEQDYRGFCRHPNILDHLRDIIIELANNNDVRDYFFDNALNVFINPYDILTDPIADETVVVRNYLNHAIRRRDTEMRREHNNN